MPTRRRLRAVHGNLLAWFESEWGQVQLRLEVRASAEKDHLYQMMIRAGVIRHSESGLAITEEHFQEAVIRFGTKDVAGIKKKLGGVVKALDHLYQYQILAAKKKAVRKAVGKIIRSMKDCDWGEIDRKARLSRAAEMAMQGVLRLGRRRA